MVPMRTASTAETVGTHFPTSARWSRGNKQTMLAGRTRHSEAAVLSPNTDKEQKTLFIVSLPRRSTVHDAALRFFFFMSNRSHGASRFASFPSSEISLSYSHLVIVKYSVQKISALAGALMPTNPGLITSRQMP